MADVQFGTSLEISDSGQGRRAMYAYVPSFISTGGPYAVREDFLTDQDGFLLREKKGRMLAIQWLWEKQTGGFRLGNFSTFSGLPLGGEGLRLLVDAYQKFRRLNTVFHCISISIEPPRLSESKPLSYVL